MNWVRLDISYGHLDYINYEPEEKLEDFINTIDKINRDYGINFKMFIVLKPVQEITETNENTAETKIDKMIDVINDFQLESSTYFRNLVYAYQVMNEPPKKEWHRMQIIFDWGWKVSTSIYSSSTWMRNVVDAAKNKISNDGMNHKVTVNLLYPRFVNGGPVTEYHYINGELIWIRPIINPILETAWGQSPAEIGLWYEDFWYPLADHVDVLGVDIYPEDMIWLDFMFLEKEVRFMLIRTGNIKDFWICETPARDGKYDGISWKEVTPEDVFTFIKWEVESGAKAISIYQFRDSGEIEWSGENWAYGLYHGNSNNGHPDFIEAIKYAAYTYGRPFLFDGADQKQEERELGIQIASEKYGVSQTFISGASGKISYIQIFSVNLPPNTLLEISLYVEINEKWELIGLSEVSNPEDHSYVGWITFEFDQVLTFSSGTKFRIICEVQNGAGEAFLGHTHINNAYPNGQLYYVNLMTGQESIHNEDLAFRTYMN